MTAPSDQFSPQAVTLFDAMPIPLVIFAADGVAAFCNAAAEHLWGWPRAQIVGRFNVLTDPQSVANRSHEVFARALGGESFEREFVTYYENRDLPGHRIAIRPSYFPLRADDGSIAHVAVLYRDVTAFAEQEAQIAAARSALAAQQQLIQELSSPVTRLWDGILLLPLVGSIDARRSTQITEQLLEGLARHQASVVIVDIAGVPVVDTAVANHLFMAVQAARLLGAEVVLVGISSETAQTIVQLGVDLSHLTTMADLQAGLAYALRRAGLAVVSTSSRSGTPSPAPRPTALE